jgi:HK97 gp10 family phage protein
MSELISVTTSVVGDAEIRQRFLDFGDGVRERLRRTLADLGKLVRDAAAALAPRKSGALADGIRARLVENDKSMTETVRPSAFYARFLEFGTVNHGTARNKAARVGIIEGYFARGRGRAKAARVRELRAQGEYRIKPHPFMGPAVESVRSRIEESLRRAVLDSVEKANS